MKRIRIQDEHSDTMWSMEAPTLSEIAASRPIKELPRWIRTYVKNGLQITEANLLFIADKIEGSKGNRGRKKGVLGHFDWENIAIGFAIWDAERAAIEVGEDPEPRIKEVLKDRPGISCTVDWGHQLKDDVIARVESGEIKRLEF